MIRYNRDDMELENALLKMADSEGKMTLRKFLAIFELNALSSMR